MPDNAVFRVLAKHRQARIHLEAFHQAMRAFLGDAPCRTEGKLSDDHMEYVFTVHDIKQVPEEISLLAGDIVHNCRACLDHLAWEISQSPGGDTYFPIKTAGSPVIFGGISAAHQAALDSVQPVRRVPSDTEQYAAGDPFEAR